MKDNSTPEQLLTRLAEHRARMAELGAPTVQASRYDRAERNQLTQAVDDYYTQLTNYWTPEDG
jgi:hypothetical protein